MKENVRIKWNTDKLEELYPSFRDKIAAIVSELESLGFRPRIQDAWRSREDQLKAFNSGNSRLKFGFHNVTGANGAKESLAVDMVDDDLVNRKKTTYEHAEYLLRLAAAAQRHGLTTGIGWGLEDFPKAIEAIGIAITNGDWKASLKNFGWDPEHIQPTDITLEEARSGKRPS